MEAELTAFIGCQTAQEWATAVQSLFLQAFEA